MKTTINEDGIEELVKILFSYNDETDALESKITEIIKMKHSSDVITSSEPISKLLDKFQSADIPCTGMSLKMYIDFLQQNVIDHSINVNSPNFVGHMTSMLPVFHQSIGRLMNFLNQNVVKVETSKIFTLIERQVIGILHKMVYNKSQKFYDEHMLNKESHLGIVISGGTMANTTSMWIARNRMLYESIKIGEKQRVFDESVTDLLSEAGYKGMAVIGSTLMHYSVNKMASILGIGYKNIIKIPLYDNGCVNIEKMEEAILNCREKGILIISLIGIAGTTETGKIDDLQSIAKLASKYNIHYHVDAAWGGPILLSDRYRYLLDGIQNADTITICGHKQLYLPQGISVVLVRNLEHAQMIRSSSNYQARQETFDMGKCTLEGSRPIMSLYLHAGLCLLGKKGYSYLIDKGIESAKFFVNEILNRDAFELIEEPMTNIVVYRYIPYELRDKVKKGNLSRQDHFIINCVNEILQDMQFNSGKSFISRTTLCQSKYGNATPVIVLRAVICNPHTNNENLIKILDEQEKTGKYVIEEKKVTFSNVLELLARQTSSLERQ